MEIVDRPMTPQEQVFQNHLAIMTMAAIEDGGLDMSVVIGILASFTADLARLNFGDEFLRGVADVMVKHIGRAAPETVAFGDRPTKQ